MNRILCTLMTLGFTFAYLAGPLTFAQEEPNRNLTFKVKDGDKSSSLGIVSPQENDSRIARWLIVDQQGVVECSKMAQERSTNENVKLFAQLMVTEHSSCLDKLEAIRKNHASATNLDKSTNQVGSRSVEVVIDPNKAGVLVKDTDGKQRDGKLVYQPTDFVKVKEDTCKEVKAKMAKEMKALSASDFDRAYMMHMVGGHEAMIATCKAIRPTASKEFQLMIDQNVEKLTNHAKQARQLCDQISGKNPATN